MSGYRFKQIKKFVPYMWADEDFKNKEIHGGKLHRFAMNLINVDGKRYKVVM